MVQRAYRSSSRTTVRSTSVPDPAPQRKLGLVLDQAFATYERDGRWYADGVFSDVTERKAAEARLAAEHAVTRVLAEAQSLERRCGVLRAIAENLGCAVAALWRIRSRAEELACEYLGTTGNRGRVAKRLPGDNVQPRRGCPAASGESRPAWIPDADTDANFPRRRPRSDRACAAGSRSIQTGGELTASWSSSRRRDPRPTRCC
jgi:hypothetical protein